MNEAFNAIVEGYDYRLIEAPRKVFGIFTNKWTHVEILRGPFEGVIYRYGKVWFAPRDLDMVLHYNFKIISSAMYTKKELKNNSKFNYFLGEILEEILAQQYGDENSE